MFTIHDENSRFGRFFIAEKVMKPPSSRPLSVRQNSMLAANLTCGCRVNSLNQKKKKKANKNDEGGSRGIFGRVTVDTENLP